MLISTLLRNRENLGLKTEDGKSEKRDCVLSLLAYWSVVLKILVLDLLKYHQASPVQMRHPVDDTEMGFR